MIGIGAYQDTLRFRREVAADLAVRRQRVGGIMLGEHGSAQVPIWSSVSIHGLGPEETRDTISQLRRGTETADFDVLCAEARAHLEALVAAGQVAEAFAWIDTLPPDARVVLRPFITHFSGAKTVRATANVTVDLVTNPLDGREVLVAGQADVRPGEFLRAEWDPPNGGAPADRERAGPHDEDRRGGQRPPKALDVRAMNTYAVLLKLRDKPGAMESIAATFAHQGISLATILANDAANAPDSLATVLVTFRTTLARKETMKRILSRLSRVVSVTERTEGDAALRESALVRLAPGAALPTDPQVQLSRLDADPDTGETLWARFGPPAAVEASVSALRSAAVLRAVTIAVVAL